jgi:hypothetical protein
MSGTPEKPNLPYRRLDLPYPSLPKPQATRYWPSSVLPPHFASNRPSRPSYLFLPTLPRLHDNVGLKSLPPLSYPLMHVPSSHHPTCHILWCNTAHTGTHYTTSRSHQMQKHKFSKTCPSAHIVGSTLGAPEQGNRGDPKIAQDAKTQV